MLPAVPLVLLVLAAAGFLKGVSLPLLNAPVSRVLYDRNGHLLGAVLATDDQWRFPAGEQVPEKFAAALIAYEDKRFHHHGGVDLLALLRAFVENMRAGRIVSGGSTITMQVIRLSRPGRPRSVPGKILEAIQALRLETLLNKSQILALYAAHAPFGGNVVGLEAAAWRYFGRSPNQLSWAEAATLAVLPNSPALIHPGRNRARLKSKRNLLIDRLHTRGVMDKLTCRLAKLETLPPKPIPIPSHAPHLLFRAVREQSGQVFRSTLIRDIQMGATRIVTRHSRKLAGNGVHNAAVLVLDVSSGSVLAYVGNVPDFSPASHENYVDVIMAPRSTGSILKPLLYAGMLDAGELLPAQLVADIPTRMGGFRPENFSRDYQGAVPAFQALARSLNVPAVRLLRSYGVERFHALLKSLGMQTLQKPSGHYGLSLILGGAEGRLWDITSIYAGLARAVNRANQPGSAGPDFFRPRYLPAVAGERNGSGPYGGRELGGPSAWLAFQAMLQVVRPGAESAWRDFNSSSKVAWKTGTSYGHRDAWAVGVTSRYAVGVWVGNADGDGRPGLTGLTAAAPILFDLYSLLGRQEWFEKPELGLQKVAVCSDSGFRAGPHCRRITRMWITEKAMQSAPCPYCRRVPCDPNRRYRVHADCQPVNRIESVKWFVLPPAIEWYYRKKHSNYRPLPPYREDCLALLSGFDTASMSLIYPDNDSAVYIPRNLDGRRGRLVFEAAHRSAGAVVYWHLDSEYLGLTRNLHQMSLAPEPGRHVITLVDDNGEQVKRVFTVLSPGENQ